VILRRHTERVETVHAGLSVLCDADLPACVSTILQHPEPPPMPQLYGDGRAAHHIARICGAWLYSRGRGNRLGGRLAH
jgi:hypothetical protein